MSRTVFLIGMPASGKTTWGQLWASSYNYKFIDLDARITLEEAAPVTELFTRFGEPGFREIERRVLLDVLAKHPTHTIVACGGGTPIFFDNLERMKVAGCVVYLEAELELLVSRVAQQPHQRPLLSGTDRSTALQKLLTARQDFYRQAHLSIPAETLSLTTFAQILAACTNRP